jgi:predicted SprT family Zn-dependent metalloprotease
MQKNGLTVEQEDRLVEVFNELNARHFASQLPTPRFMSAKLGKLHGMYLPIVKIISLPPKTLERGRDFYADTMLHELIHFALEVRTGDHAQHHGQAFVDLANTIGASLGLPTVRLGEDAVLYWPQSARGADYPR